MVRKRLPITGFLALSAVLAVAQDRASRSGGGGDDGTASLLVTAAAREDQVRFTALGVGLKIRLEVLDAAGDQVFDSDFRDGNLLDWRIQDQRGNPLSDGLYGCLVTLQDLTGQWSRRHGILRVVDGAPALVASQVDGRAIAASSEREEAVTILDEGDDVPTVQLLHDGVSGRIVSGKGELSFRIGNGVAGGDVEHMRLTSDGRLGLGLEKPSARLDVNGLIRTSEGIVFPDGTVQRTAANPVVVSSGTAAGRTALGLGRDATPALRAFSRGTPAGPTPLAASLGAAGRVEYTEGEFNTLLGSGAGTALTSGIYNAFVGYHSGNATTTGSSNSMFGDNAGAYNVSGQFNTYIGSVTGYFGASGSNNTFLGFGAGKNNTVSGNTFTGYNAGFANTSGGFNAYYGFEAGTSDTTGGGNSFFGWGAGRTNLTGNDNSIFGAGAGSNNTASYNSFFGQNAGNANTSGTDNAFFGRSAGMNNTTGDDNSFVGMNAGLSNTTGGQNAFLGFEAGVSNLSGRYNSYVGNRAGRYTNSGWYNVCLGSGTGANNTSGSSNTFIGVDAGVANTTESYNSAFGRSADVSAGITNATALGSRAKVTQSNSLVLGGINGVNGATADTRVGIGTTSPAQMLEVRKDQAASTYIQVTNLDNTGDPSRSRFALVAGTVTQEMQSIAKDGGYFGTTSNHPFRIYTNKNTRVTVDANGNVGIGTTTPTTRLHVAGDLRVTGAILYGAPDEPLPDYVFEPGYALMPLEELGKYLGRERHLPKMPSASEIKEKGLDLAGFQMRLLEKIEELTLYTVQQARTIRAQQAAASLKDAEIVSLNARLAAIEKALAGTAKPEK